LLTKKEKRAEQARQEESVEEEFDILEDDDRAIKKTIKHKKKALKAAKVQAIENAPEA